MQNKVGSDRMICGWLVKAVGVQPSEGRVGIPNFDDSSAIAAACPTLSSLLAAKQERMIVTKEHSLCAVQHSQQLALAGHI